MVNGVSITGTDRQVYDHKMRLWHSVLIPFKWLLRMTEYLAGPPVPEEITTLQEDAEKWKRQAAALETDHHELQGRLSILQSQRDDSVREANALKQQRDVLKKRIVGLEKDLNALKEAASQIETSHHEPTQMAGSNGGQRIELASQGDAQPPISTENRHRGYHFHLIGGVATVILNVTVFGKNRKSVAGLKQNHFHVYEDNVEQMVRLFLPENTPATIGLIIDNAGTLSERHTDVMSAAWSFIAASNPEDEMFIVNFNREASLALAPSQPFTSDRHELKTALSQARSEGPTALYDALSLSLHHLEMSSRLHKAIVVLSDGGVPNNSMTTTFDEVLWLAQQSGVTIYCIGIYDAGQQDRNHTVLKSLATDSGGDAFFPDTIADLHSVWAGIAGAIQAQYTIGYAPSNPIQSGKYRKIHATVHQNRGDLLRVRLLPGYIADEITSPYADQSRNAETRL
jgi:VWFA-related protein